MPPPVDNIRRSPSMPNLAGLQLPPANEAPQPGAVQPGAVQQPQVVAPLQDPALQNALENGNGPDLQQGGGQGAVFAANHAVAPARDWDFQSAEGMLETARKAVDKIKTLTAGREKLDAFNKDVSRVAMAVAVAHPGQLAGELAQAVAEFKEIKAELEAVRAALASGVKDGSECKTGPRDALAEIRKTLRAFRYETQRALGKAGFDAGEMEFNEGNLRAIQNFFTFRISHHVSENDISAIQQLENRLLEKLEEINGKMAELDHGAQPIAAPEGLRLADGIGEALELSHLTNDRIREFQDSDSTASTLRGILGEISEKGGSRTVEFNAGIGALFGLGFSQAGSLGVRAGARFRITGTVECEGKGRPISVTFRWAYGAEGKVVAKAGVKSSIAGAKAQASALVENSHFTTRTYATLDDLLLDAKNCKLATSRTIGGAIVGGLKALGRSIGKLGAKVFRAIGRRSDAVKQDNAAYLQTLKDRGVAGSLDKLLAKRANPMITAIRTGRTVRGALDANGSIGGGVVKLSGSASASIERDWHVSSQTLVPLARTLKALGADAIAGMMRPGPDGGDVPPVPHFANADEIADAFDMAIEEAKTNPPDGTAAWARLANMVRSLMIAVETGARNGTVPRAEADRLLARFSNPEVKFPEKIFREYLMDGAGSAKPAKIRKNISFKAKVSLFEDYTGKQLTAGLSDLTKTAADSFIKAGADGLVTEARRQIGLDSSIKYSYSSEKPANPGEDPRPWENSPRSTHELEFSRSLPFRAIADIVVRTVIDKGELDEHKADNLAKDIAKGIAVGAATDAVKGALASSIPGLLVAAVKESAKAALIAWLQDPENIAKLVDFVLNNADKAFYAILDVVEFALEHPNLTLQAIASVRGASNTSETERTTILRWSLMDGKLDNFAVFDKTSTKIGFNVDPVGVGVGVGFDLSYKVDEMVKSRSYTPHPPFGAVLRTVEDFLYADDATGRDGNVEALKNWMARNRKGVEHVLSRLEEQENAAIIDDAIARAPQELADGLRELRREVRELPADAAPEARLDAARRLFTAIVQAYHV